MSKNLNLNKSKSNKNDEFYTKLCDIEKELSHYKQHLKDKVIYCNCDNPNKSAFWEYFHKNFSDLGISKLIATFYDTSNNPFCAEYCGNSDNDINTYTTHKLFQNGDFRSGECIELLKDADIIITNPPFSLFRDFINLVMQYDKKFLIIGSKNAISYKEVFPLLKNNSIWLGCNNVSEFIQPDGTTKKFGNICWFTNLDHNKRHGKIIFSKFYSDNEYPKYHNYNAIEVSKLSNIPIDYDGVLGVPLTFFDYYNPEQFEIIGMSSVGDTMDTPVQLGEDFIRRYREQGGTGHYSANMNALGYFDCTGKAVVPFCRILIKKRTIMLS
jgi:hypothetical protein